MHHSHKIERKFFLRTSTFTNSNDRYRRRPIHIIAVSITNPATWGTIKGKMAVQRRDMGHGKSRSQRENVQISTRGKMGMHNIETLRYLFLHKIREDALGSTIVFRRDSNPGRGYLCYSHNSILSVLSIARLKSFLRFRRFMIFLRVISSNSSFFVE